jgi:predicted permease
MSWLRFFRRAAWDDERASEMDAHIRMSADDLMAGGMARDDAWREANRAFGNPRAIREEIYMMNSVAVVEQAIRDARYAARVLRKSPGFTLTAVLTLAVAIGINTAVFSVVDAVLLKPLPYPAPERLALVSRTVRNEGVARDDTAQHGLTWETIRDHATAVDAAVFSSWPTGVNLVIGSTASYAQQQRVGAGFFRVLDVPPAVGREFTSEEDRAGGPRAVILSHHLWQREFGADPIAVGRSVTLRGEAYTIIGVMPRGFRTDAPADLWTPLRPSQTGEGDGENYAIVTRLRPQASWAQSRDEVAALGIEIGRRRPARDGSTMDLTLVPLQLGLTASVRQPLLMVWSAVAIILAIACVNLSGLLLARASTRRREIATRMALGSGRSAVLRQMLVEGLVLAAAGGVAGIAIGYAVLEGLHAVARDAFAITHPVTLDGRAIVAAMALSFVASVTFGIGPAIAATRLDVQRGLSGGGGRTATAGRNWSRRLLAVAQVSLGVVLLVAAGLLLRSFTHLRSLNPGFDPAGVVAGTVSLQDARYRSAADVSRLFDGVLGRLQNTPGVEAAAVALGLPYQRLLNLGFRPLDGAPDAPGANTSATYIAGDYFGAMRMPIVAGRGFDQRDRQDSPGVAIVSETFARTYLAVGPHEYGRALGRRIGIAGRDREIIGVAGDVQVRPGWGQYGPLAPMPVTYLPVTQVNDGFVRLVHGWFSPSFIVRADERRTGMPDTAVIARALSATDPLLPLADVRPMREVQETAIAQPRLLMTLLTTLAAAAVLLAAIGIHGLIATSVTERTREIGIRLALGSTAGDAVRAVAMPGVWLALAGVAAGVLPAPALRILRLDPAATLRHE